MKAISINQPFAWLIAKGIKDIENRSWKTKYRGALAIHASKTLDKWAYDLTKSIGLVPDLPPKDELEFGALIGTVNMVDCVEHHPSKWFCGPYGFVFESAEMWAEPIPWKGKLSLFDVPYRTKGR